MKDLINKEIILYLVLGFLILGYGFSLVIPKFTALSDTKNQINQSKTKLQEFETLKQQKDQQKALEVKSTFNAPVKVFKSIYADMTIENSSVELFDSISNMLQSTGNNITEISYNTDNIDEKTKAKLPANFHILSLKLKMNCSYLSLQNFFKKIYTWDYLYSINSISLIPSINNPRILDVNMDLWLFIEK